MSKNSAALIRDRLLELARARNEDFNFVLAQYAIQRLLYRLSISEYKNRFLLKGAWLFSIWSDEPYRATRDADFLGFGENDPGTLVETFRAICSLEVEDGLEFDLDSFRGVEIKEDAVYSGIRLTGYTYLAKARIAIQVDVAFGDAVRPGPATAQLPVFLDLPAPELRVYPVYSVIAEKFQAMVVLGLANSRMKDFYDIWRISQMMDLEGGLLAEAIGATFKQRATELDGKQLYIFSDEFRLDKDKQKQWRAFFSRNKLELTVVFPEMIDLLHHFLGPVAQAADEKSAWDKSWSSAKYEWVDK